jgi:hypothetical protein
MIPGINRKKTSPQVHLSGKKPRSKSTSQGKKPRSKSTSQGKKPRSKSTYTTVSFPQPPHDRMQRLR